MGVGASQSSVSMVDHSPDFYEEVWPGISSNSHVMCQSNGRVWWLDLGVEGAGVEGGAVWGSLSSLSMGDQAKVSLPHLCQCCIIRRVLTSMKRCVPARWWGLGSLMLVQTNNENAWFIIM